MKKHRIASIFSVLFIVALCLSLFAACNKMDSIEENQVEKIVAWVIDSEKEYELSLDEANKFIELFNAANYEGKSTGEGGTPQFGIRVYFSDGAYLQVNDFDGLRKLEVYAGKANGIQSRCYYVSSKELYALAAEMVEKAENSID